MDESSTVILEPLEPAHAAALFEALQDERLYLYYAGSPPKSVAELERRYQEWATRRSPDGSEIWLNYAVRRPDGTYVGWVQATIAGDEASIGYDIFPKFWRRGFGKAACRALLDVLRDARHVALVRATVDDQNVASLRLLDSLGFVIKSTGPSDDMPGRTDRVYELRLGDRED